MKMRKLFKKGFTLVELVVVIAVIAVLAAVSVGAYFGVTDSANSSNADVLNKQVRDLWLMYSVSDYDEKKNGYDNAIDFCLRYFEENGAQDVNLNFKAVDTPDNDEILIKIETEYPTWVYIDDSAIKGYSKINKSEEEFNLSVTNAEYIIDELKNDNPFEIEEVVIDSTTGETKRGLKYYTVNVENAINSTLIVKKNRSIVEAENNKGNEFKDVSVGKVDGTNETAYGRPFRLVDAENKEIHPNSPIVLEDSVGTAIEDIGEFAFNCGTLNLKKLNNSTTVNLETYPICLYSNSKATFFPTFYDLLEWYKKENNTQENVIRSANLNGSDYLFLGNCNLDFDLELIGFTIALEYKHNNSTLSVSEMSNFVGYKYQNNIGKIDFYNNTFLGLGSDSSDRMTGSTYTHFQNIIDSEKLSYTFTLGEGATLKLNNSTFLNEGYLHVPMGDGTKSGYYIGEHCKVINNGTIELNDSSAYRSLGLTTGIGKIVVNENCEVYELFKHTSELGAGEGVINQYKDDYFPFPVYELDNIRCFVDIKFGASYNVIAVGMLTPLSTTRYVCSNISLVSNDGNSLFCIETGNIIKGFNSVTNKTTFELTENTKIKDGNFNVTISVSGYKLVFSNTSFNFPLSNMEFILKGGSSISLSYKDSKGNASKYLLMPDSSIVIEENASINIQNGASVGICNFTDEQLNEISGQIKMNGSKVLYEHFKNIDKRSSLFIEGSIEVDENSKLGFANLDSVDTSNINSLSLDEDGIDFLYIINGTTRNVEFGSINLKSFRNPE